MGDYVGSIEVAFASTYVKAPTSTIRINTEPPRTLNLEEAEKSAGFFDLQGDEGSKQRFIFWRANGPNLYLEEHSLNTSLVENSLCICLHGSQIIPGTYIFYANKFLFIYCPTQTAIHKFFLYIPADYFNSLTQKSVLNLLHESSTHLPEIYDSYELNSQSIASRAHIAHDNSNLYATFCLRDMQIISARMTSLPTSLLNVEISYLHSDSMFQRMLGSSTTKNVSGVASLVLSNECFSFILFGNGIIQVYSDQKLEYSKDLMEVMSKSEVNLQDNLVFASMKVERSKESVLLLCQVQYGDNENFILISRCISLSETWKPKDLLEDFKTIFIPVVEVVDISCLSFYGTSQLIVISLDEFKQSTLLSCSINWESGQVGAWETTRRPYTCNSEQNYFLNDNTDAVIAKRLHIFNPNNYSFDIVLRSALLVCKHKSCEAELQKLQPNDWNNLKNVIDFYVASPQFLSRLERKHSQGGRADEPSKLKFWTTFEKSCNELSEATCNSLGVWYSLSTGLYGTVQEGRFTVCIDGDKNMLWLKELLSPTSGRSYTINAFNKCLKIACRCGLAQPDVSISDEQMKSFVHSFSFASNLTAEILKKFITCCATELKKPKEYSSDYHFVQSYGDAILPGIVSAALRQRITDRLRFTDAILSVIRIYYLSQEKYRVSMARWETALANYGDDLQKLNRLYRVLLQGLSIRFESHFTHTEVFAGDSFFADGGLEIIRSCALVEEYLEDDSDDIADDKEDAIISNSSSVRDILPTVVSTAVNVLWPESSDFHLAQYLAASEQYDALLNFCLLNETCCSQLMCALQFFKAVAYAGLEQPEEATKIFLSVYKGIMERDDALLKAVFHNNHSSATCSEFFLKVMEVMEKQNYSAQIVEIGRSALEKIDENDPLLAQIYTMLFKHELSTSLYADSVRTLLKNPSVDNQKMCLRELIAKLIDCNKKRELIDMDYGCMRDNVVEILEARARSSNIIDGLLYETLYAFHFRRNNFTKAALSMYEYANRFRSQNHSRECLIHLCRLLSVVHQTLLLLPVSSRYLTEGSLAPSAQTGEKSVDEDASKKNIATKHVSSINIVDENDIAKEFAIEDARLALLDEYAAVGTSSDIYTPPTHLADIIAELLQRRLFHQAWVLTRVFQIPPYDIIKTLTKESIVHYASGKESEPAWVRKVSAEVPSASEKDACSAVLRGYVELAIRLFPHDPYIPRSATDEFLRCQWSVPCWLSSYYEKHFLGDYLNLLLLYGRLLDACTILIKNVGFMTGLITAQDSKVILPYTAIDQLYQMSSESKDEQLKKSMKRLDRCMQQYFIRLDSFSRE